MIFNSKNLKEYEGGIIARESGVLHAMMLKVSGTCSKVKPGRDLKLQDPLGLYGKIVDGISHCELPSNQPLALWHMELGKTQPKGGPWIRHSPSIDRWARIWARAEELS